MQNETSYKPQQQREEEQSIDIKQLIYIFLSHWYLFLIGAVVALAVGFVVNRYKPNVYQTSGTLLVKDSKSGYDATDIMTNGSFGGFQNVDNEIAILKSYTLADRTVRKMGIEVSYMEKGRIATVELYKNAPFIVEFDRSVPQAVGLVYEVQSLTPDKIVLHATAEGFNKYDYILSQSVQNSMQKVDVTTECKQGEMVDNGYNRFRIVLSEDYNPETDNQRNLSFWLNSYASLVRQNSSFTVAATSKQSSVLSVTMSGYNGKKIVDFTNTLMNEYVSRGLEKEKHRVRKHHRVHRQGTGGHPRIIEQR